MLSMGGFGGDRLDVGNVVFGWVDSGRNRRHGLVVEGVWDSCGSLRWVHLTGRLHLAVGGHRGCEQLTGRGYLVHVNVSSQGG